MTRAPADPLASFHPAVRDWFAASFDAPTRSQALGWPPIARGESTLILSPTGSGKTLAAFLWCLDRLMFAPAPPARERCRVLYVSPLKALAVDVERNLQRPLAGIAEAARRRGDPCLAPAVAVRTGDTPASERARFRREPADLLITTPESLYLLLTSGAREALRSIDTVIVDEIHALVPTKRGAHLALSLERLQALRGDAFIQRIGLSATQRPLDEVARFLGGALARAPRAGAKPRIPNAGSHADASARAALAHEFAGDRHAVHSRPVTIVDAGEKKALKLTVDVPLEGLQGSTGSRGATANPPASLGPVNASNVPDQSNRSIWAAIHPRLLELVRTHRSTLIFVNSRRLAERMAGSLNELAGETLVRSHHGSLARTQRTEVEELLKAGRLRGLVATSSLELGIDMGAIDLVVQVEAPPSVASGLQRIGRGGHQAGAVSEGVIVPKFRGDLVACAAVTRAMHDGAVEATRYPRNPLDVLAQQIVAMAAMDDWDADDLLATIRSAAPFATLGRGAFDGVLDMLSGRYPSDEFAELRPRVTWDRAGGRVTAREGAKRVAVANGGTIPDRGLYGVFLIGAGPGAARVGELDEEMVFESRVGDTFVLGASSWRIEAITHDRVLVSPAPGEPGRMPFWKGERAGRPIELGLAIGRLVHDLLRLPPAAAVDRLTREHDLEPAAAEQLLQYLRDQQGAAHAVPDASTIVIERVRDDLGDWRLCVLSPRGGRVHAPWAMAAAATIREATGVDVDTLWGDDGFVVRFPDVDTPPDVRWLVPDPDRAEALVIRQLGSTALFAGKFRENAARSLLLPKRRPGMRAPLWQQRKRAADLLAVASRYGSFPVLLETYRECLRDFFDVPSLVDTLAAVRRDAVRVVTVDSEKPSPFAASLLFTYVASFIYDGDAPLAERRAQALAVDQAQLRELVGDAEMRELLDAHVLDEIERRLQRLDPPYQAKSADGVHDLLLAIGDLTSGEIAARSIGAAAAAGVEALAAAGRIVSIEVAGERRLAAIEDAARLRDALGIALPDGIPGALLQPVRDPLGDVALRYARTHGPFTPAAFARRYGLADPAAEAVLARLAAEGRLIEGEFRPGGQEREWIDPGVLGQARRRSLARLRREIEPVDAATLGRFVTVWQGVVTRRQGADALLDAIEQLQGAPLPASLLETDILPARISGYDPADLDAIMAAGEVVWIGIEPLGERDGRIALYLADDLPRLLPPRPASRGRSELPGREAAIVSHLRAHGASFFAPLHDAAGGGYPAETVEALWRLVWSGVVTNDTMHALRAYARAHATARQRARGADAAPFRSRRAAPPSAEGRWTLVPPASDATHWAAAVVRQLLARHGVLTREVAAAEAVPGGFGTIYPVLKRMEETGHVRRGYFVAGLGAAQFALPAAVDRLRALRDAPDEPEVVVLAATDPANPCGAVLRWPAFAPVGASARQAPAHAVGASARQARAHAAGASARQARAHAAGASAGQAPAATRSVGATVVFVNGALAAYVARGDRQLSTLLPEAEPARFTVARAVAEALAERARAALEDPDSGGALLIETIDGVPAAGHPFAAYLIGAGFSSGAKGMQVITRQLPSAPARAALVAGPRRTRSSVSSPFARRYFDEDS